MTNVYREVRRGAKSKRESARPPASALFSAVASVRSRGREWRSAVGNGPPRRMALPVALPWVGGKKCSRAARAALAGLTEGEGLWFEGKNDGLSATIWRSKGW